MNTEPDICEDPENCDRMHNEEDLVPVRGFENYFINKNGDIFRDGKKLKPQIATHGYRRVSLYKNGYQYNKHIHIIALETFIGKRPKNKECNHKNGIKWDNRIENLEWVTRSENIKHAVSNGLIIVPNVGKRGESASRSKLKDGEVWLIKRLLSTKKVTSEFLSKMFKVHPNTIYRIKQKINWKHIHYNPYICINPENCDELHNEQEPGSDEVHHYSCNCSWCLHVYWTLKH